MTTAPARVRPRQRGGRAQLWFLFSRHTTDRAPQRFCSTLHKYSLYCRVSWPKTFGSTLDSDTVGTLAWHIKISCTRTRYKSRYQILYYVNTYVKPETLTMCTMNNNTTVEQRISSGLSRHATNRGHLRRFRCTGLYVFRRTFGSMFDSDEAGY